MATLGNAAWWQGGRPVTTKTINPRNGYLVRVILERWESASNAFVPYTQATPVAMFATDIYGNVPIGTLANIALTQTGTLGTYATVVSAATLEQLTPYIGQTIYQIVTDGTTNNLCIATALVVRVPRWAQ